MRYLVEGSVRRSGDRLRISARLVDGASAGHVWAGRFDGAATDVFDLQDQLTEQIVGVIEPSVRRAEIERARRKRPGSLDAYDLYLRALPHALANTAEDGDAALRLLGDALRLDPSYLAAHGYAAWCHEQRYLRSGFDPADRAAALAHADIALGVNADDPQAMSIGGLRPRQPDPRLRRRHPGPRPGAGDERQLGARLRLQRPRQRPQRAPRARGRARRAGAAAEPARTIRSNYHPYCALALTNLFAGRFEDAVRYATLTIRANPGFSVAYAYLVGRPGRPRRPRCRAGDRAPPARGRARASRSTASRGWTCSAPR